MITQQKIDKFFSEGFLIVDANIKHKLLDEIIRDTIDAYSVLNKNQKKPGTRLQDLWKESENVKKLALSPKIISILEQLYHRKPLPFQTLNFPIGTQQALHSDTVHFNSFPNNFMCGAWVALEDIDVANGPVCYCPGSHKLPEFNMQDVGKGITYDNYKHYEEFIKGLVKEKNLQTQLATINKGEVFIWHGNLLHGGSPQRDKDRTRHSQGIHYFFEGCSYYTPMLSTPENIHFRAPEWIEFTGFDSLRFKFENWISGIY